VVQHITVSRVKLKICSNIKKKKKERAKIKITQFFRQDAIDFVFCMLNKQGRYNRNHEIHLLFLIYSNEFSSLKCPSGG